MAVLEGTVNTTIKGETFIAVSNAGGNSNLSPSNDIVALLHSHSATAGLLDAAELFDAPKCDESTWVSMLRGMKNFVQEGGPSSLPAVYWLHGPAGVGKSALAQSLALSLQDEGDHAASFFFSRTSPGRNDGNQLILTLAYQLAISFPALQPFILKTFKKNPAILTASNAVKMQSLIVDPINEWQKKYERSVRRWAHKLLNADTKLHPRLIFVDGLDECSDPQVQQDLILCIGHAVRQLSLPFRFVIASRPESHIMATFRLDPIFQGPRGVKLLTKNLGDDDDANEQIMIFLLKECAEIRRTHPMREFLPQQWPLPGQIAQLVAKSSKGFIYPATVVRYIKMPNNRPDECLERILGLLEIPIRDGPDEPLNILYRHIFESIPDVNKEAVRDIFHFLVVPNLNLGGLIDITPHAIEKYFDYKPGHVQHVLRDLLCVVTVTSIDHPIKVLHASLTDFLLDRSRSGPLYIDMGDVHAAIAASFPLALRTINPSRLPDFRFAEFLEHMMQSNMSNTLAYHRLVNVDFRSQYIDNCNAQHSYIHNRQDKSFRLFDGDIEGIAFMVAYLLVLVIKDVQQTRIRRHITEMEAYILQNHPFAASLLAVRSKFFPAMIPSFREWVSSTIDHGYIDYIFTFKVPPSQLEIREEIFELYFLMTAFFLGHTTVDENHSQNVYLQPCTQQLMNYSNHISHTLLEFLLRSYRGSSVMKLKILAVDLAKVSLAYAGYSTSLTTLLAILLDPIPAPEKDMRKCLRRLTPAITDYLERVYLEAPVESQQDILELNNAWKQYLNQQNS